VDTPFRVGPFHSLTDVEKVEHHTLYRPYPDRFSECYGLASPPQAPRANAICERIIGTLRREVSDQLLIVSEHHLRQVLTEYLVHYDSARPHRALGQLAPDQAHTWPPQINLAGHRIRRKQVLSGLTSEYQIAA